MYSLGLRVEGWEAQPLHPEIGALPFLLWLSSNRCPPTSEDSVILMCRKVMHIPVQTYSIVFAVVTASTVLRFFCSGSALAPSLRHASMVAGSVSTTSARDCSSSVGEHQLDYFCSKRKSTWDFSIFSGPAWANPVLYVPSNFILLQNRVLWYEKLCYTENGV